MEIIKNLETELAVFDPIMAGFSQLETEIKTLKVKGFEDKEGYQACKSFRTQKLVKLRTAIEAKRSEVKRFYLDAGNEIDKKAKEITAKINILENYCKSQEKIIEDEAARVKAEKEAKLKAILDDRIIKLQSIKANFDYNSLGKLSDQEFESLLKSETDRFNKEESERIAKEKELEHLRKLEAENQARLQIERKKAEAAQQELIRLQREEIQKKEAELLAKEKERKEAEAKIIAEQEKQRAIEHQKELEAKKREAEAKAKIADEKLFKSIQAKFPSIESAWIEIARLTKLVKE